MDSPFNPPKPQSMTQQDWILCATCSRLQPPSEYPNGNRKVCNGCRRYQRGVQHLDSTTDRNPAKLSQQRDRWPTYGKYPPPFKTGTAAYAAWYRDVVRQARAADCQNWAEFYAKAKEDAYRNPPKRTYKRHRALFGGSRSHGYRAWYYRTMQACKAEGPNTNWPEFFAKARQAEMERQGLVTPVNSTNITQVQAKPHNVVPFNPNRTSTGSVAPRSSSIPADGPLRFDFSVDDTSEREWR